MTMLNTVCRLFVTLITFQINQAREGPPRILPQSQRSFYYSAASNSSILLTCRADGSTPIRFVWEKNGLLVKLKEFGTGGGIFDVNHEIFNPTPNDEGEYICYVSNDFGDSMTDPAHLTYAVLYDHNKENDVYDETPVVNRPYTLPCEIPHSIPEPEVYWTEVTTTGGGTSQQRIKYDERITSDIHGNLHVLYILNSDAGSYRCVIYNSLLQKTTYGPIFNIQVTGGVGQSEPELLWNSNEFPVALHGSDVMIRCIIGGRPLPNIVWTKVDTGAPVRTDQVTDFGRTLVLNNVRFSDAKRYECSVPGTSFTNGVVFDLVVEKTPSWIRKPSPIQAYVGEDIVFNCSASGIPEPTISWYIDAIAVADVQGDNKPSRIENTQLTGSSSSLLHFTATSSFSLICEVYNAHGYMWDWTYLYVSGTPQPTPRPSTQAPTTAKPAAKTSNSAAIGGSVGGIIAVVVGVVVVYCAWSRRRRNREQPEVKPNVTMAYRNRGFNNTEQPMASGGKGESYTGLSVAREKAPQGNVYDELGGASNASPKTNDEAEYCYISDSDIIAAQRASKNPIPSVRNNRSTGSGESNSVSNPLSSSVGYNASGAPSSGNKLSHFPSGKYSSLDDPVYRGQTGNTQPPSSAVEYEEPKTTHEYFVLEPEHSNL
ncbi:hemicentin-2-like [Pecten maximus]|uniref:hemicentin-2-like n=1 Tax=Pecten maximus TaxID=6579 RepID=UPI00145903A7|nr:hemicentin-2-like [Pecten maximus]